LWEPGKNSKLSFQTGGGRAGSKHHPRKPVFEKTCHFLEKEGVYAKLSHKEESQRRSPFLRKKKKSQKKKKRKKKGGDTFFP